jgi:hypothetical protein
MVAWLGLSAWSGFPRLNLVGGSSIIVCQEVVSINVHLNQSEKVCFLTSLSGSAVCMWNLLWPPIHIGTGS